VVSEHHTTSDQRASDAARDIKTIGKNYSDPLVQTGPGEREPQNRRAVIDLGFDLTAGLALNADGQ
jgi:hypothetical protein